MISALLLASSILSAPQILGGNHAGLAEQYYQYSGFKGVNVAGGEFGSALPGVLNTDYFFDTDPSLPSMQAYAAAGSNAYRVPFSMERMLPVVGGDLDPTYLAQYKAALAALPQNAKIIVDCHNYGIYNGVAIGIPSSTVSNEQYADFWVKLGTALQPCTNCIFGLANEPAFPPPSMTGPEYGQSWATTSAVTAQAMRAASIQNTIAFTGIGYSNPSNYQQNSEAATDAAMAGLSNVVIEFHPYYNYLPQPGLNIAETCSGFPDMLATLQTLTNSMRAKQQQAFIGEFATNRVQSCIDAAQAIADLVKNNADVWIGIIAWGGGEHYAPLSSDGISLVPDAVAGASPILTTILPSLDKGFPRP